MQMFCTCSQVLIEIALEPFYCRLSIGHIFHAIGQSGFLGFFQSLIYNLPFGKNIQSSDPLDGD
jgi:hypothetical protein